MAHTRQQRLNDAASIRKRIRELFGKKINIVLHDQRVLYGELISANDQQLTFKNMRGKNSFLEFTAISEIYFDSLVTC